MVEGALIDIMEQGRLDAILARNLDRLAKSIRFMDALTRRPLLRQSQLFLRIMLTEL